MSAQTEPRTTQEYTMAELVIDDTLYTIVIEQPIVNESIFGQYTAFVYADEETVVLWSSDSACSDPSVTFGEAAQAAFSHWLAAREGGD